MEHRYVLSTSAAVAAAMTLLLSGCPDGGDDDTTGIPADDDAGDDDAGDDDAGDDDASDDDSSSVGAAHPPNDYDGDGASDLAVFERATGSWSIRTLAGDLLADQVNWGFFTTHTVPGDYDGDGTADLAVFHPQSGNWYAATLDGEMLAWELPFGWSEAVPVSGDLDGDGVHDIVVFHPPTATWYAQTLGGDLLLWEESFGGPGVTPLACDFDGDGADDLAVFDPEGGLWDIRSLSGDSILEATQFGYSATVPVPGDYDGDGVCDLAAYDRISAMWYANTLAGDTLMWDVQWGYGDLVPVPGDYDGDGCFDLASYDRVGHLWYIKTVADELLAWELEWGHDSVIPVGGTFARGGGRIAHVGDEVYLGSFGRLTAIAHDAKDQPHAAVDGSNYVGFYDKVDRTWQSIVVDMYDHCDCTQYYNPHIELDRWDNAWVSGILFGAVTGIGMFVRTDMASSPSDVQFSRKHIDLTSWDTGIASFDIVGDYAVASSSSGYWQKFTYDETAEGYSLDGDRGQLYAGAGGEKNVFTISRAAQVDHGGWDQAIWHGATVGCSTCPSPHHSYYQNTHRQAQGADIIHWADWQAFDLGDDHNYPWLVADSFYPHVAYMMQDVYGLGIALNIWDGSQMVFDPTALPIIEGAESTVRFAPQGCAAAGGGMLVAWSRDGTIWMRYVSPEGVMGEDVEIGAGHQPALIADSQGTVHLVYIEGGVNYRRILTF